MKTGRMNVAAATSRNFATLGIECEKEQVTMSAVSSLNYRARRLPEESGEDVLLQEVLELLERMRVDLSHLKGSVDLRENTERIISSRSARHSMASRPTLEPKQECRDTKIPQRLPCSGFRFVPMATAPLGFLSISEAQGVDGAAQQERQQLLQGHQPPDVGPAPNCPPWNASTSLQDDIKSPRTTIKTTEAVGKKTTNTTVIVPNRRIRGARPTTSGAAGWDGLLTNCASSIPSTHEVDDGCKKTMGCWSFSDEQEVRDYLRRLNIVTRQPTESEERIDDPVLNGVALRRLVALALGGGDDDDGSGLDAGKDVFISPPLPKPKNLEDVRLHYLSALGTLRNAKKFPSLCVPRECWLIRPEGVIMRGDSRALFLLLRALIDSFLPLGCQSIWSSQSLTWRFIPDASSYKPSALHSLEKAVCGFLCSQDVLADPTFHQLPPDDAIVPDALHAPFLPSQRRQWHMRKEGFPSLYIPSVFPFLTNGTVLCDLVELITGERLQVHRNPRVNSNCIENIQTVFYELQKFCPGRMSNFFIDDPHRVFYGDRWYILMLLEDIMRLAHNVPPRRHSPCLDDEPYLGPKHFFNVTHSTIYPKPSPSVSQPLHLTSSESHSQRPGNPLGKSPVIGKNDRVTSGSTELESPRCVIASPLSRTSAISERLAFPARSHSFPHPRCEVKCEARTPDVPPVTLSGLNYTEGDVSAMVKWLAVVLGPDFRYTAANHSFSFSSHDIQLQKLPLLFSDGVLLAHLIRTLERRRCPELETIELNAKSSAAKRRNIRKCVLFLQTERRVLHDIPLLDEVLLSGDLLGVLYVIQCLKTVYRFACRA